MAKFQLGGGVVTRRTEVTLPALIRVKGKGSIAPLQRNEEVVGQLGK